MENKDKGGFLWGLLGFISPIVGLVLFLVWKDEKPKTAKSLGKGALISVILSAIVTIFIVVSYILLIYTLNTPAIY